MTIESVDQPRTYTVKLTDLGRELAEKRVAANDKAAEDIISCLSAEEVAQLDAITEKLILGIKDKGVNGITRKSALEICKKKGYKVRRKRHRR